MSTTETDEERAARWPTPDEFVDELLAMSRDKQVLRAERIIGNAQEAVDCFVQNHQGRLHDLECIAVRLRGQVARVEALIEWWHLPTRPVLVNQMAAELRAALAEPVEQEAGE